MVKKIINCIKSIVAKENVMVSREERICYSYDGTFQRGIPDLVAFPGSKEEIAEIIKLANEEGFPVFPRGAGTGLSGGSIPQSSGLALVLTRMNRIKEINQEDMLAVVEPGVVTGVFHEEVEKMGLFYPPDPASLKTCTMGGNIAENAGGPRAFKYGVTKDYVLGLEVVTPQGEIMHTGGRTVKNVTGYDLTRLITGSEGTLGIVTEIILRLLPKPQEKRTALVIFDRIDEATSTVMAVIRFGVIPATLELMDRITINCVEKKMQLGLPLDAEATLLMEIDGPTYQVEHDIKVIEDICRKQNCREIKIAVKAEERENLWKARRAVSSAIVQLNPTKISEDATVPRSKIPEMVKRLRQIAVKYDLKLPVFGHAGDGNLHPNILTDKNNLEEMERVEKAEALLPPIVGGSFRKKVPYRNTVTQPRLKIAYFTGCMTNLVYHQVGYSLLKIMKAYNVEVIIPPQFCCGIPAIASGDDQTGRVLGERNVNEFSQLKVDYILCDCASFLSTWLEYPELLENEEAYRLVPKVMDINRFLVGVLDVKITPPELGIKVTYYDPCYLKRTPGGKTAPRELLKRLSPGCQFVEMNLADRCCGSAGSFNLSHYHLSQKIAAYKEKSVLESGGEMVTSACPSCIMQLGHSLKKHGSDVEVKHVIELVARCC